MLEREESHSHASSQDLEYSRFLQGLLFTLCCLVFSRGYRFRTVRCLLLLRLGGIMSAVKGHTATGCSENLIDDVSRLRLRRTTPRNGHFKEISLGPNDCTVADAQSIKHSAKVVSSVRNYRLLSREPEPQQAACHSHSDYWTVGPTNCTIPRD